MDGVEEVDDGMANGNVGNHLYTGGEESQLVSSFLFDPKGQLDVFEEQHVKDNKAVRLTFLCLFYSMPTSKG